MTGLRPNLSLEETAARQVPHQRRSAERPGCDPVAVLYAVRQGAERGSSDGDDIADGVGEALAGSGTIDGRREHGAEEQHQAVRILMVRTDRVLDDLERIAA